MLLLLIYIQLNKVYSDFYPNSVLPKQVSLYPIVSTPFYWSKSRHCLNPILLMQVSFLYSHSTDSFLYHCLNLILLRQVSFLYYGQFYSSRILGFFLNMFKKYNYISFYENGNIIDSTVFIHFITSVLNWTLCCPLETSVECKIYYLH